MFPPPTPSPLLATIFNCSKGLETILTPPTVISNLNCISCFLALLAPFVIDCFVLQSPLIAGFD